MSNLLVLNKESTSYIQCFIVMIEDYNILPNLCNLKLENGLISSRVFRVLIEIGDNVVTISLL